MPAVFEFLAHTVEQSLVLQEFLERESYVPRDPTKQERRYIASRMKRNRSRAAVRMPELLVGSSLRTSTKPILLRTATTSFGLRTGAFATAIRPGRSGFQ
jgi:hypothetical protein